MRLGDPVRVVMTKWGDRPHWEYDARWLGSDEHGSWYGTPAGTLMARPGMSFHSEVDQVGLVPTPDAGGGNGCGGWVATFHAPWEGVATYVDMTTVPVWDGPVVRAVDLDLDVIRWADGSVVVDDEDEFLEHREAFGYPSDVVSLAESSCAWVRDAVLERRAPFDGPSSDAWLAVLVGLPGDRRPA